MTFIMIANIFFNAQLNFKLMVNNFSNGIYIF